MRNTLCTLALCLAVSTAHSKDPQIACLAEVVYREARGEPWRGKVEVIRVVQNRSKLTGNTYCQTVQQPHQFAYRTPHIHDLYHYQFALFFHHYPQINPSSSTSFHNQTVKPYWATKPHKQIGQHTFYK